ncbi:MAG: copper chaperone PCu(A)C [Proteobacteria bacterium]|nr:copper chaperone PCu(A)C [Pseudomonadota bacterium]
MRKLLVLAAFALAACGDGGGAQTHGLHVENGWVTPTPGGVNMSAGYVTIVNDSDFADRLMSAASTRAANVSLHDMQMDGAVMRMRPSGPIAVPAHGRVSLAPSGAHLMFNGVITPFTEGEQVRVQLTFEHAGAVSVELPVMRSAPEHH